MIGNNDTCYICDMLGCYTGDWLECHHIFNGAYRKKSEKYGLTVMLCHQHHNERPYGVHFNRHNRMIFCRMAQRKAMQENGWTIEEFIKEFGKNYLEDAP